MTVDVKLLAALALPLTYFFALAHLLFWLVRRERKTHLWWAAVNLCGAIGVSLLVSRHSLPRWVTTSLANTVILGASFILWAGIARFAGRKPPVRIFLAAALLFFCLFQGLWSISEDLGLRVLLASIASAAANAGTAIELIRMKQRQPLRAASFLAVAFALHAMFFLFRSATAVTLDASEDFMQSNGIQNVAVTISAIKLIAWNIAATLMVRERERLLAAQSR